MKTTKRLSQLWGITIGFLLFGAAGMAVADISITKHNLSSSGTGSVVSTDNPEVCVFCHTPHQAIKNDNITLWNHTLSATATYGVYTSPTFDATDAADVGGVDATTATATNLCLSCHDGTIAINSLNNASNINPTTTMSGVDPDGTLLDAATTNLGGNLADDHPVNFTYDATLVTADGGLTDPATHTNVKLYSGKVQCASCHDPHSETNGAFLRASMDGSGLCTECHAK